MSQRENAQKNVVGCADETRGSSERLDYLDESEDETRPENIDNPTMIVSVHYHLHFFKDELIK